MASFNKVILMGNMTRDPEIRIFDNGGSVANFGIAVNDRWKDRNTGEQQEEVCFVDCEAWGRQAEIIEQYLSKGSPVHLEGKLKYDTWETEDGQRRSKLKLRVFGLQMLGRGNGDDDENVTRGSQGPQGATVGSTGSAPEPTEMEDIPF